MRKLDQHLTGKICSLRLENKVQLEPSVLLVYAVLDGLLLSQ